MRLRGASETWKVIEYDFNEPAICFSCNTMIFCIQDAMYVLCPSCRVVSPLEESEQEGSGTSTGGGGGGGGVQVGLRFTFEDLSRFQQDIQHALKCKER